MEKYPKFKPDDECAFPEREDCNYGEGYERCPYMECISVGNWKCIFTKELKEEENAN